MFHSADLYLVLAVWARSSCREKQTRLIFQVQIYVLEGKGCNSNQVVSPMTSALTFLFRTTTDMQGILETLCLGAGERTERLNSHRVKLSKMLVGIVHGYDHGCAAGCFIQLCRTSMLTTILYCSLPMLTLSQNSSGNSSRSLIRTKIMYLKDTGNFLLLSF